MKQECGQYKGSSGKTVRFFKTDEGFMILSENGDVTCTWGEDGMCGASGDTITERVQNGLKIIGWDTKQMVVVK